MRKKLKKNLVLAGMRVPLPKQGEKVIIPKTAFRRGRDKQTWRKEVIEHL